MLAFIVAAFFVMSVIIRHLYVTSRTVAEKRQLSLPAAALRTMRNDPGYWGGQISHLGVALLALGIAISANLTVEADITLTPGSTEQVAGFDITYVSPVSRQEPTRFVTGAQVEVAKNGRVVGQLEPRLNQYPTSTQAVATPEVDASWSGDLYLSLKSINAQQVTLGVFWFPFIWLVWVGGFVMAAAVLWSRLVKKPRDKASITERAVENG
jgi:cytochrome c-type biogenesis protein CcmF